MLEIIFLIPSYKFLYLEWKSLRLDRNYATFDVLEGQVIYCLHSEHFADHD